MLNTVSKFQVFTCLLFILLFSNVTANDAVFDMHMHYKWSQKEVTSPEEAIAALAEQNIAHAVVIGKPAENALLLKKLAPDKVIPIFSPYRDSQDWYRWQRNHREHTRQHQRLRRAVGGRDRRVAPRSPPGLGRGQLPLTPAPTFRWFAVGPVRPEPHEIDRKRGERAPVASLAC